MKSLILGIGGFGVAVAERFFVSQKGTESNDISYLGIDSDLQELERNFHIPVIPMTERMSVREATEKIGVDVLKGWFPIKDGEYHNCLDMSRGANGWRLKGLLAFEYMLCDEEKKKAFDSALAALFTESGESVPEIYIAASLCGGTGSGVIIPAALYAKKYASDIKREVKVYCFAACANIFADMLTAENRIRAYSNEYAAIRELNAVRAAVRGGSEGNSVATEFCIGSEESFGMGMLFDGKNPRESFSPAENVFFVDKIPSICGVTEYEEATAKLIGIVKSGVLERYSKNGFYGAISYSETIYPYRLFADYAAYKLTAESVKNEWLYVHSGAEKALYHVAGNVEESKKFKSDIESYAASVVDFYKQNRSEREICSSLATGKEADYENDGEPYVNFCDTWESVSSFKNLLHRAVKSEEDDETAENAYKDCDAVKQIKLFDSKERKQAKKEEVVSLAAYYYNFLLDYYDRQLAAFSETKDKALKALECEEFSLKKYIGERNGKRFHPAASLVILCDFYMTFLESQGIYKSSSQDFFERKEGELPRCVCGEIENEKPAKSYFDYQGNRLRALAEGKIELLGNDLQSYALNVANDFRDMYYKIKENVFLACLKEVRAKIEELLNRYRRVFSSLYGYMKDAQSEEKLKLVAGTTESGTVSYAGVSEENKKAVYGEILKESLKDERLKNFDGEVFEKFLYGGEPIFTGVSVPETAEDSKTGDGEKLLSLLERGRKELIADYETIKKVNSLDIVRVIHDENVLEDVPCRISEGNRVKKATCGGNIFLDIDTDEGLKRTITRNVVFVPEQSVKFAEKILGEEERCEGAIKDYFAIQGDYESDVFVNKNLPADRMIAARAIFGFEPYDLSKFNDDNAESLCYKNYLKARFVSKAQNSEMWDPYICANLTEYDVPFINPAKQKKYDKNVIKAYIYMLDKGLVSLRLSGNSAYECYVAGNTCATFKGNVEDFDEWQKELIGAIAEDYETATAFGRKFDDFTESAANNLPVPTFSENGLKSFASAITCFVTAALLTSDVTANVRAFKKVTKENAFGAVKSAAEGFGGEKKCVRVLSEILYELADKMILKRLNEEKEAEAVEIVRKAVCKELKSAIKNCVK